jgi:hypothetical protein
MLYRITFRKTDDNHLHIAAHPGKNAEDQHVLVGDYENPVLFARALGLAGVSSATECQLAIAAEMAWDRHRVEICCEAADFMDGELETLNFHQ